MSCDINNNVFMLYQVQSKLEAKLAKRAEHYFSENMRVMKGNE